MFYVSKICGVVSLSRYILCGDWSAFILAVDASSVVLGLVKGEVWEFEDDMLNMTPSTKFKQVSKLSSTSWKTIPNSLETKSSFSSPLTKRAITNWNRQHTTPSLNKQGFCRVFLSLKLKKYQLQIAPILHRDHRNCPVSGKGAIPVKFWIGVCLEMSETLTLFNDEAKDNCPNNCPILGKKYPNKG